MIALQNISKTYSSKRVLTGFNLDIEKGKTVSLIGPSGCGKSTLIRIIMGLIQQDEGTVEIDKELVSTQNILSIRRKIGYVIQNGGLFPHLTAKENCELAAKYLNWAPVKIKKRISELVSLTNINPTILNRLPTQLSGGQQQRVSLIRALMLDPDILLFDEPLGSIDPLIRYDLQSDLKQIFKSLNKTVILVTHDLGEAAYLGDEIVLINEGEIIQKGSIKEFIRNPKSEFVTRFVSAQRSPLEVFE